ncbi:hypothetical protein NQ314_009566 [Rhamnusium bicolor]|uniref:Uncharacterized protein n=1 Tax=Rhamnusium bicolor TaxID=1586634 RepID=A0AAV8XZ89_9CUCU|nr:hypothetical protein NQ314_009566 [Rhamnusium bicolor]
MRYIMIFVGKWYLGFQSTSKDVTYKIYSLAVELFFLWMTQQTLISIIIFRDCPERATELICYYIQYTNSNICSFLSKRDKMKLIYNYIIDYELTHLDPVTAHIYLEYAKLNRKVVKFFLLLTAVAGTIWYVLVVKDTFAANCIGACTLQKGLNFQIWYPFDLYNKCYGITLVVDIMFYISAVSVHIFNKISPVSFMIFILGQIKILQEMIRNLQDIDNKDILKAIIACIKKHQEVIRYFLKAYLCKYSKIM